MSPKVSDAKSSEKLKRQVEVILASVHARGLLQAIAGHVMALSERGEYAERALRQVCAGWTEIEKILESSSSLPDRFLRNPKTR
jgi:hypothetical protein